MWGREAARSGPAAASVNALSFGVAAMPNTNAVNVVFWPASSSRSPLVMLHAAAFEAAYALIATPSMFDQAAADRTLSV